MTGRRVAYVVAVLLGCSFIVVGGAYALRGTPVAYRVEPPAVDRDALSAAVEGCVRADGRWIQGTSDGVLVARCVPSLGVYPVKRGGK